MLALVWTGAPEPRVRTNAVVLQSIQEFEAFGADPHSPPGIWGFRATDTPFEPVMALGGTDSRSLRVLTHELVHDLSAWYMPIQPAWYAEGLATFLETVTYDRRRGLVEAGVPPPGRATLSMTHRFKAPMLLDDQFSENSADLGAFESRAWLLVHFLVNTRPRDFDHLSAALEAGKSTDAAWAQALPDFPIDRLDKALDAYAAYGVSRFVRRALAVPPAEIRVRDMTDAEVHVVRAQLFRLFPGSGVRWDRERVRRELEEAIASDPTNTEAFARRVVWFTPPDQRPQFAANAERIASAHPQEWLAWLMVEVTARAPSARRTALARALSIDQNQPAVLNDLAAIDLADHRYEEALLLATKGMSFRQVLWPLAFNAMEAHWALGHCADAVALAHLLSARGPRNLRPLAEQVMRRPTACTQNLARPADGAPPSPTLH